MTKGRCKGRARGRARSDQGEDNAPGVAQPPPRIPTSSRPNGQDTTLEANGSGSGGGNGEGARTNDTLPQQMAAMTLAVATQEANGNDNVGASDSIGGNAYGGARPRTNNTVPQQRAAMTLAESSTVNGNASSSLTAPNSCVAIGRGCARVDNCRGGNGHNGNGNASSCLVAANTCAAIGRARARAVDNCSRSNTHGDGDRSVGRGRGLHHQSFVVDEHGEGIGRGALMRGRRRGDGLFEQYRVTNSRPQHVAESKSGGEREFTLLSNHSVVTVSEGATLYQYHVDFAPDVEQIGWKHRMLFRDHSDMFEGNRPIFDGTKCIARVRLPNDPTEVYSSLPETGERVRITLKLLNELATNSPECLHVTNVMFNNFLMMNLNMSLIGRNYYSTTVGRAHLPQHRLDILSGFESSILQFEAGLQLEIDTSHKVLRSDSAYNVMTDIHTRFNNAQHRVKSAIEKELIGAVVMTRHNNKTYRVHDIDWTSTPASSFEGSNGPITYAEYFTNRYGTPTLDSRQPMLVIKPKARERRRGLNLIYLPPQLCMMTGLTDNMTSNYKLMSDVAQYTRIGPAERCKKLQEIMRETLNSDAAKQAFGSYGYSFSASLLPVPARSINNIEIHMGSNTIFPAKNDWSQNLHQNKIIAAVRVNDWSVVVCNTDRELANNFVAMLTSRSQALGVFFVRPNIIVVNNTRDDVILTAVKDNIYPSLQLMVLIMPSNRKSLYDGFKKVTCIDKPVSSQAVISRTLRRNGQFAIVGNICLQMQAKLGGELWRVVIPNISPTMVIGIDVYHDAGTGRSGTDRQSVVGMVASLNRGFTRYFNDTCFQGRGEEVVTGLRVFIVEAVKRFQEHNSVVPNHILVYRDGVGDGQLQTVLDQEVVQISEALTGLGIDMPKITFIVVKKRINIRFFAKINGRVTNPVPGTVVDSVVTRPEWYDFYLISQSVRQGTVSPTHYNVLRDNSGWSVANLQKFTYMMTHLYYNWPGTLRVPACVQYAHRLAFLAGQSLHRPASKDLADKLFFL